MTSAIFKWCLLALLLLITPSWANEKPLPSLAILHFKNQGDAEADWLASGLSHVLISKLSDTGAVKIIEREHIKEVLGVRPQSGSTSPEEQIKLLGADILVVGSFIVSGKEIRVNMRIVSTQDSSILPRGAISERGEINNIFHLEDRLAKALVRMSQLTVGSFHLEKNLGKNSLSHTLYLQAKQAYESRLFEKALELAKDSQAHNQNLYFPEAHHLEGKIRIAMASAEEDQQKKKNIQDEHIKVFRVHAAEASHAFFDLGLAQQSMGQNTEAIKSYKRFLMWCSENSKLFLWDTAARFARLNTPTAPGYYGHGKRMYAQNDCWCCRQYIYRGWKMENESTLLMQKDDQKIIRLVCMDNLSGKKIWETIPPGLLNPMKLSLLSQDGKVFLVSDRIAYIFNRKDGSLEKTFSLECAIKDRRFGMLPQILYEPKEDVLIVYKQLLIERRGEYAFHVRAYSASEGKLLWEQHRDQIKHRQGTVGLWKGKLVLLQNGTLQLLDVTSGRMIDQLGMRNGLPVVGYWPEADHLLVRYSRFHRLYNDNVFWKWRPGHKDLGHPPEENIFFTYQYNKIVEGTDRLKIPVVDRNTGFYKLVPAMWLLPKTAAKGMDSVDNESGNLSVTDSIHHPWVRLDGDRLWVWNRNRMIHLLDARTGELLWRHYLPSSGGGIDSLGHLVTARVKNRIYCLNAKGDPLSRRSLMAQINMAKAQNSLGQYKEMVKTYENVILKDSQNLTSHQALAQYYESVGNMGKAAFHHDHVLRFANRTSSRYHASDEWMKTKVGLVLKKKVDSFLGIDLFGESLLLHSIKGLEHIDLTSLQSQLIAGNRTDFWSTEGNLLVIAEKSPASYRFLNQELKEVHSRTPGRVGAAVFSKIRTGFSGSTWGMPYLLKDNLFIHRFKNSSNRFRITPYDSEAPFYELSHSNGNRFDSNGKVLLIGEQVFGREKGQVSHFMFRAYPFDRSKWKLENPLWEKRVAPQGRQRMSRVFMVGNEVVAILDSYETHRQQSFKTSTMLRFNLKNGELLSRTTIPKVSLESVTEREDGLLAVTIFKRSVYRESVFYEEGMDMDDILSRKNQVNNGDPFHAPGEDRVLMIGAEGLTGPDDASKLKITDGRSKKVIWSKQAFAIEKPSSFVANSQYVAFKGDGTIYVLDMKRFLKFVETDLNNID